VPSDFLLSELVDNGRIKPEPLFGKQQDAVPFEPVIPLKDNVPTRSFPVVTVALIAANVVVWLWEIGGTPADSDIAHYAYYPCAVQGPCLARYVPAHHLTWWEGAFTSMFMHASWGHIGGNMLFLWIFGNNVEDALGRVRFFLWYVACGLVATAGQTAVTLHFGSAVDASVPNVGASGAIAGVLGGFIILFPRDRILVYIFPFWHARITALLLIGFWFVIQLVNGVGSITASAQGGVAYVAHVGGFIAGAALVRLFGGGQPPGPSRDVAWR
jgi:membrane associated rhomboid family serine protease